MAVSTCCLLSLNLLLLSGGLACLGAGIYLVSSPAAASPSPSAQPVSSNSAVAATQAPNAERPGGEQAHGGATQDGAANAATVPTEDKKDDNYETSHESSSEDKEHRMISYGTAPCDPALLPRRSVGGGVTLLVAAACLLGLCAALAVSMVRRRAVLSETPPAKDGLGEPGVATIEPRGSGAAAQEKSGLPPAYGVDNSWNISPPAENPYYATVSFEVPPPAYSDVCSIKSP